MNKKVVKKTEKTSEAGRIRACLEIGKLLTSTLKLNEILEVIIQKARRMIDAQNWSLLLKDEATGELVFKIVEGTNSETLKGVRIAKGAGIVSHVAKTCEPVFVSRLKADPRFNGEIDKMTGFKTKSIVCIPLKIHGKALGVIEILNVENMRTFKSRDLPVLTILADYAAIAIENSRHLSKIRKMTITDEYTVLYNARYLHKIMDKLIKKAQEKNTGLAVVIVDIDDFKEIVDEYGHLSGTQVLREVGETISSVLGKKDILIKYGGDEYVIILPDTDKKQAVRRIEQILESLRGSTYLKKEKNPVRITASFGIAMYPQDANNKKDLLLIADNSMYKIKKTCKNSVGTV